MSHLREHDANTQLMPVLFPNGLDRRNSARIPLAGAVRMGPPSGDPYATVSARDVSTGGLFIDADRPVKLGARFSAEIQLGSGKMIYVPEAEVAYNRENPSGSGFGVRFVDPPAEIIEVIEREIEKTREAVARVPTLPPVSTFEVLESHTIAPVVEKVPDREPELARESKIELKRESVREPARGSKRALKDENATEIFARDTLSSLPQEPSIGDDAFDVESYLPESAPAWWEEWMRVGHDLKARVLERSRRVPLLWTTLAITGSVLVVSAIGLALWSGTRAEAVEVTPIVDRGVTAGTHQALMGDKQMPDVVIPKRVAAALAPAEAKKPLPPLVYVEEVEKPVQKAIEQPKPATKSVEKPAVVKPVVAKAVVEKPAVVKPVVEKPAIAKPVVTKPAAKPSRDLKTRIGLAANARVLKTHVLRAPDRFVIDIAGQDKAPSMPGVGGGIKSIRVGKHPDYTRIVIETSGPIDNGRASKKGGDLSVAIELR
jgi:hypothetical protein